MAVQGALVWICSLAVLSFSAAQDETLLQNCSSQIQLLEHLTSNLKEVAECAWSSEQTAGLLLTLRNLTDTLHRHQLRECQGAEPQKCPEAEVPENGGLLCVTVSSTRYCKPMCNHGHDFTFLRRSRLYDECSEQTGFKWPASQFIGGNRWAVCDKAQIQISAAASAYFSKDQDCLTTKSSSLLDSVIKGDFISELRKAGVQGEAKSDCLVCG
ncbi:hypothetical protein PBY51_015438 [Eleginops maclovinus]|uniref:Uncharacterized protein n=1 Tax=Eleginops maclovinus TaxID=56733 RepID=A0AAN7X4C8_ELEMC|nr:hypothetical protein PBY51_015438 [Eleginops maclovinus]